MNLTIQPRTLTGAIRAIPSKSMAHRALICSAFSDGPTELECPLKSGDIEATTDCLRSLGADISRDKTSYRVHPVQHLPDCVKLGCRESGSTLRFLLPVMGALGIDATFCLEGRLARRPLSPLWEEMERMGCTLSRPTEDTVRCCGRLRPGVYSIRGDVSSQFVTGLLLALPLLDGESRLELTGNVESAPYITMTHAVLKRFGVSFPHVRNSFEIRPCVFRSPGSLHIEGDWSNGAFWLAAKTLGSRLDLTGLDKTSVQGDRAIVRILAVLDEFREIDVSDIPDLVPVLAVVAAAKQGARFCHAARLRLKESDRLESTAAMIHALGGRAEAGPDSLSVYGTGLSGGTVDAAGDHRIAMAAAIAATVCTAPVTIVGAEAVCKSYPDFWVDYKRLGGTL